MNSPQTSRKAFTLVEVVLGLGVISFCLTILMGLFAAGLLSSKRSHDDTQLATLTWSVANELRATNAYELGASAIPWALKPYTNFYDVEGQVTTQAAAYYTCNIGPSPAPAASFVPANVQVVRLVFTYPNVVPAPYTNIAYVFLPPS